MSCFNFQVQGGLYLTDIIGMHAEKVKAFETISKE